MRTKKWVNKLSYLSFFFLLTFSTTVMANHDPVTPIEHFKLYNPNGNELSEISKNTSIDDPLNILSAVVNTGFALTITCPLDVTIECGDSIEPMGTGSGSSTGMATGTGASGIDISYTDVVTPAACPQISIITRTWVATDDMGNTQSCDQIITIEDTTPPSIDVYPSSVNVEFDGNGNIGQFSNWLATNGGAVATDACSNSVFWSNNFSGFTTICGNNSYATVTFFATDDCGLTSQAEATFTIFDPLDVGCIDKIDCTINENEAFEAATWNIPPVVSGCSECIETNLSNFIYLGYFQGHQYFYSTVRKNWAQARSTSLMNSGHLVAINSAEENKFLTDQLRDDEVYIGLSDAQTENQYRWVNENSPINPIVDFLNLDAQSNNTPDNDFGLINETGTWTLDRGIAKRYFIMERPCVDITILNEPDQEDLEVGSYRARYRYRSICGRQEICAFNINVSENTMVENCETGAIGCSRFWIRQTILGSAVNTSDDNEGYGDFSNQPFLYGFAGESYGFRVALNGDAPDLNYFVQVWIDWNQDGDFYDENEHVMNRNIDELYSSNVRIDVDSETELGNYNMRIIVTNREEVEPCGFFDEGEAEDYVISIVEPSPQHRNSAVTPKASLFPNPSSGLVYLQLTQETIPGTYLEIHNLTGQRLMNQVIPTGSIGSYKIDLDQVQLVDGYYLVKMIVPNQEATVLPLIISK